MVSKKIKKGKDTPKTKARGVSKRIYLLVFFVLVCCVLVVFRLYNLQVKAYAYYREMADGQHKLREEIMPKRGEIFLQEKENLFPVAVNKNMAQVVAVPTEIEEPDRATSELSRILSMDEQEIRQKITKQNDKYEVIKRKLSSEEETAVAALGLKGVYLNDESWRYYPGATLASQVVGFVGYNEDKLEGRYGLEKYYEDDLRGASGFLDQERDTGGRWISIGDKKIMPAQDGSDLILSIDHIIQFKAELAVQNAMERHGADRAGVIVMDPYDGRVLAMAAAPSFNLNDYSTTEDINLFRNSLVSDTLECGSVFKSITMAAGLDAGKVTPDTTYYDSGSVTEAGYTIKNSDLKGHGQQTMTNVIEKSLNTGAIYVEKQLGNDKFLQYIKDFGFGSTTGIDLPGEAEGNLSNLGSNRNIEYFTASFGQGITVTPIQIIRAYAAIANGGDLIRPHVVDYFKKGDQETKVERQVQRKVISKNAANQMALMLESNVINGHGKMAGVPGYRVAGKTGTAQKADKEHGGYLDGYNIGSFAGFAPVDNPKFVMLVVVDNPKDVQWAESTAAPVFGELSKFMLDYYAVQPTEPYTAKELETFNLTHNSIDEMEVDQQSKDEQQPKDQPAKEEDAASKSKDKKKN